MEKVKKVVIIEAQRIFRREKHGMDFVALELIRQLQKLDLYNQYIIAVGLGDDVCLYETSNFKIEVLKSSNYLIWEQLLLPNLVKKYNPDLLHCTSNTAPLSVNCPVVLTLHDVIFMEGKLGNGASLYQRLGRIYRRFVVPRILNKVSSIITVSQYERNNIVSRYPHLRNKIKVVYNGVSDEFLPIKNSKVINEEGLERNSYWLFLGNTDPKKNLGNTLLAFAEYLNNSQSKRKLLLVDISKTTLISLLDKLNIKFIEPYLIIKSYISHDQLPDWYSYAFGSLYTSLRESFGLPLLESMACDTVVIGSNTSAIPEIAGESIIYVDPMNPNSISEAMLWLEKNPSLMMEKIRLGKDRYSLYSWSKTGEETLSIYNEVWKSNSNSQ